MVLMRPKVLLPVNEGLLAGLPPEAGWDDVLPAFESWIGRTLEPLGVATTSTGCPLLLTIGLTGLSLITLSHSSQPDHHGAPPFGFR